MMKTRSRERIERNKKNNLDKLHRVRRISKTRVKLKRTISKDRMKMVHHLRILDFDLEYKELHNEPKNHSH